MNQQMRPMGYRAKVGDLFVHIDYEAQAISITREGFHRSARTEDLGQGFLVDRDEDGFVGGIEAIAGRGEQNPASGPRAR